MTQHFVQFALITGATLGAMTVGCSAAHAAEPSAACAAPVRPAGDLAPWPAAVALASAADRSAATSAVVRPGRTLDLSLHPAAQVRYPAAPRRQGGNGGLAELRIDRAGTYRIAVGSAAWIDVIAGDKALESTAHGHGEACTGIRKVVDFVLERGRYILAISAAPDMRTRLLVARKP